MATINEPGSIASLGIAGFRCSAPGCLETRSGNQLLCRVHMQGLKHVIARITFTGYHSDAAPTICSCGWEGVAVDLKQHRAEFGEKARR